MAKFKLNISDPTSGKTRVVELEGTKAASLIGRRIGETVEGTVADLAGCKLQVTGGTDKDGFPMRRDIHGGVKARVLLSSPPGFHSQARGERKRKTVRGNLITEDTVQVNMKVAEGKVKWEDSKKPPPKEAQT